MSKKRRIAFVLGNGTSRKPINLELLRNHGTVYGCNAVYREFVPDHLICVDTKMIIELSEKLYQMEHSVWSNSNKLTTRTPNIQIINPNKGWSSGPTAMMLASLHEHNEVYLLGFDYVGLGENNEHVNNLYAGTKNYKRVTDRATYYGNWTRQTMICSNTYPRVKYYRVIPTDNSFIPDHLKDLANFSHITTEAFKKTFS
jgi:hypothetical protein|tara:strand:+ start:849 stop:1448 length:600 start_codon:yes stop_codon:yes gene_type:complete